MFSVPLGILFGADVCFLSCVSSVLNRFSCILIQLTVAEYIRKWASIFFGVDYAGRLRLAELSRTGLWLQHISETSWERCSSRYLIPTSISSTIILTRQAWPQSRKARYSTKCKTVVATTAWGSGSPDIDWAHLIFVVSACHPYLYMPFLTLWILYEFLPACAAAFAFD